MYSRYELINGKVFDTYTKKYRKVVLQKNGYNTIRLYTDDGEYKQVYFHRLIASRYLGLDLNDRKTKVDHINGIKTDNRVENLRLCSQADNVNWGKLRKHNLPKYISPIRDLYQFQYKGKTIATRKNLDELIKIKNEYLCTSY